MEMVHRRKREDCTEFFRRKKGEQTKNMLMHKLADYKFQEGHNEMLIE